MSVFLMILYLSLVSVFPLISHPFLMALVIIFMSITTSLILGTYTSSWLFFSLMMIFLGGMMVMFLYFISLMNNSKVLLLVNYQKLTGFVVSSFLTTWISLTSSSLNLGFQHTKLEFVYMSLKGMFLYTSIMALLICLLMVVKNTEIFKGSLEMSHEDS